MGIKMDHAFDQSGDRWEADAYPSTRIFTTIIRSITIQGFTNSIWQILRAQTLRASILTSLLFLRRYGASWPT